MKQQTWHRQDCTEAHNNYMDSPHDPSSSTSTSRLWPALPTACTAGISTGMKRDESRREKRWYMRHSKPSYIVHRGAVPSHTILLGLLCLMYEVAVPLRTSKTVLVITAKIHLQTERLKKKTIKKWQGCQLKFNMFHYITVRHANFGQALDTSQIGEIHRQLQLTLTVTNLLFISHVWRKLWQDFFCRPVTIGKSSLLKRRLNNTNAHTATRKHTAI